MIGPILGIALVAACIACAIVVAESALYLLKFGPYFRFGPVVSSQIWRTSASLADADVAVRSALEEFPQLAFRREEKNGVILYSIRKSFVKISMWPAITLRLEDSSDGAVIKYEARPFMSTILFLPLPLLAPPGGIQLLFMGLSITVIGVYAWGFVWEIPRAMGLFGLRERLSGIGVRVCPRCGYDVRASANRCPECAQSLPPGVN
jgi:hypothetical protein